MKNVYVGRRMFFTWDQLGFPEFAQKALKEEMNNSADSKKNNSADSKKKKLVRQRSAKMTREDIN